MSIRQPNNLRTGLPGVDQGLMAFQYLMQATKLIICLGVALSVIGSSARAQLPQTRIHGLFPVGGQAGQTLDISITSGLDLDEIKRLFSTHPGFQSTPKTRDVDGRKEPIPNQFELTISPDVPPGDYELFGEGLLGASNPRLFRVGNLPEVVEIEPNNTKEQAQRFEAGSVINGRMNAAADVDWFCIKGQQGERLLIESAAKQLDSRFDSHLELFDGQGNRLAAARNNWRGDAVLEITFPAPGDYFLKVSDFVFGGGEEYPYRLRAWHGPQVLFSLPPAGVRGTESQFVLYGRNLPEGTISNVVVGDRPLEKLEVKIPVPQDGVTVPGRTDATSLYSLFGESFSYRVSSAEGPSDPLLLGICQEVPIAEQEPNDNPNAESPVVNLPGCFYGQFQQPKDIDTFEFLAKTGESFWIDVAAQRLGSSADPFLVVDQITRNDQGKETVKRIGESDDDPFNPISPVLETRSDDPVFKFTAPADGRFRITLRDRFNTSRGNPAMFYLLSVQPAQPDVRAVVVPGFPTATNQKVPGTWSAVLRQGDNVGLAVAVKRIHGFVGEVTLEARGLPAGVISQPVVLGENQPSAVLVLSSSKDAPPVVKPFRLF